MLVVHVMVDVAVRGEEATEEITGAASMVTVALQVPLPPAPKTLRV